MLTEKQREVVECIKTENPRILICCGAKRSGKTFVLIWAFLRLVASMSGRKLAFILAGASGGAIRRNVLSEMERILGRAIKLDTANSFALFGNRVYCLEGGNSASWKRARGFTAAGAYINEGTALNDMFVKEVISRCSHKGARIYIDTNPENPNHPLKADYIDHDGERLADGRVNIRAFHFTLFDNTALDREYIESIVGATPAGMFTDRDIYGKWVSPDGLVYKDFSEKLIVTPVDIADMRFSEYIAGVDWGYEHYGAIVVVGVRTDGTLVLVEERVKRHTEIDGWTAAARELTREYGNMVFYCDSARPEYVKKLFHMGFRAENADKSVLSGIESVAGRFKRGTLLISSEAHHTLAEIGEYAWNKTTGEPVKQNDDALDALRYAVYTRFDARMRTRVVAAREFYCEE